MATKLMFWLLQLLSAMLAMKPQNPGALPLMNTQDITPENLVYVGVKMRGREEKVRRKGQADRVDR